MMRYKQISRLALVTETYAPEINGVANTLKYLVDGMQSRVEQLQLILPVKDGKPDTKVEGARTTVTVKGYPLPKYSDLQFGAPAFRSILNLWRQQPPSVVYIATEGPLGWAANFIAQRMGIPVVSGFHTNFQAYSNYYGLGILEKLTTLYLRGFHNKTQKTLVPTLEQRNFLRDKGFENVEIMPRGVDCDRFSPTHRNTELRSSWGLEDKDLAIIYVGRLAAEKNITLAIKSFRAIQAANQDSINTRLVFVGDGPLRESLAEENPDFIFCGMQTGKALSEHYASGDLFLFPSMSETFGNVVTEAMASGLAIVGFDYAAAKAHINDGKNGLVAPLNNETVFVEKAVALFQSQTLVTRVRNNARATAERISWNDIIHLFEKHLLMTLDTKSSVSALPNAQLSQY